MSHNEYSAVQEKQCCFLYYIHFETGRGGAPGESLIQNGGTTMVTPYVTALSRRCSHYA
jgi:hypothetical protein